MYTLVAHPRCKIPLCGSPEVIAADSYGPSAKNLDNHPTYYVERNCMRTFARDVLNTPTDKYNRKRTVLRIFRERNELAIFSSRVNIIGKVEVASIVQSLRECLNSSFPRLDVSSVS